MKKKFPSITAKIPALISLGIFVLLWHCMCKTGILPEFMVPSPEAVCRAFMEDFNILMMHTGVTLMEAFYGLLIGIIVAFLAATIMDRWEFINKALSPVLIITQTIPTIAIAPLLVLWMGFGIEPKITLVAITTFFPMAVGLLDGYKSVDMDSVRLLRAMGATPYKIFVNVKFPSALPHFFSGLKIAASYAVVGAVISEWIGGFEGLGVYMTRVMKAYAFDRMFAVILLIIVISLMLMGLVDIIKMVSMPWLMEERRQK